MPVSFLLFNLLSMIKLNIVMSSASATIIVAIIGFFGTCAPLLLNFYMFKKNKEFEKYNLEKEQENKKVDAEITKKVAPLSKEIKKLKEIINDLVLDSKRTQLLILINHSPDDVESIMKVAHIYFVELDGDWYMSKVFVDWAKEKNIDVDDIIKLTNKE